MAKAGFRILLVEDHDHSAKMLSRLLSFDGHSVHVAAGCREAVRAGLEGMYDVMISDINLDDGDGRGLMHSFRERFGTKGIAISGRAGSEEVALSLAAGFECHMLKPVDYDALDTAIRRIVGGGTSERTDVCPGPVPDGEQ